MSKIISKGMKKGLDKKGNLVLYFIIENENRESAEKLFDSLHEEDAISFKAKKEYGKRTGKQNKMFWSLINKISLFVNGNVRKSSLEQVYFDILKEANKGNEFIWFKEDDFEKESEKYKFVLDTKHRKTNKEGETYLLYECFYGTSKMDVYEMMELIEVALDKMAFLGIEDNESKEISNNIKKMKTNF